MARVKRAVNAHKKRRTTLERAAGYRGQRSRLYKKAKEQVQHSMVYSYRDRRAKKGEFRRLWIQRINAAARANGMTYNRFIQGLREAGVEVDRKILADLAVNDPTAFAALVEIAKAAVPSQDGAHDRAHRLGVEGALDPLQGRHAQQARRDAPEPEEYGYLQVDGPLAIVLQRSRELGSGREDHVRADRGWRRDAHHGMQERRHQGAAAHPRQAHEKTYQETEEGGGGDQALGPVELPDRPEVAELLEPGEDPAGAVLRLLLVGLDVQLGGGRRLVRVGDARELRDLARERLLVEALHVALGAHLEGRVDEYLDKVLADVAPDLVADLLERRDGRDDDPDPVAGQKVGHEADPQHVDVPVLAREAEALGEVGANDVPVEDLDLAVPLSQLPLHDVGYGRLAGPGETR